MSKYNNLLTMEQLFRNPKLGKVLPQFPKKMPLRNVYSGAEITSRAQKYIVRALGGSVTGEGEITIKGKQTEVLSRVRQLKPLLESFFNSMPALVSNLRKNTNVFTTYSSAGQIEGIRGKVHIDEKAALLKDVLDNINFNPAFNSQNSITKLPPSEFAREQARWFKKVGINIKTIGRRK